MPTVSAIGIPWYRAEDWSAIKSLFVDGDRLHASFTEWLKAAEGLEKQLRKSGHLVERAYIDPSTFPAWCAERGLKIDSEARTLFANEAAYHKYRNRS